MSSNRNDQEQRSKGRVPLETSVRLRYRRFHDFIQEFSANISTGGMFISSSDPHPPGSRFDFELTLEDGFSLIKGQAEVMWVRAEPLGVGRPAGMGVRFIDLDRASKTLIAKIVAKLRRKGRRPFDLEADRPDERQEIEDAPPLGPSLDPPLSPSPSAPPQPLVGGEPAVTGRPRIQGAASVPRRWSPGFRATMIGLGGIASGLVIVWLFHVLYVRPRIEDLESRIEQLAAVGVGEMELGASAAGGEGEARSATTPELADPTETLREWARAWSEQRVDDYLAFYAAGFEPAGGVDRGEWEALRRTRIGRHSGIRVQVLLVEVTELSPEERLATFVQSYRSETYKDRVRKAIRLVLEDRRWKIAQERVVRAIGE